MTRFWARGLPIVVELDPQEQPRCMTWSQRRHRIIGISRQWRIDEGWWQSHIWRDYYLVHTDTHLLAVIFHDLHGGQWYLQRLYD